MRYIIILLLLSSCSATYHYNKAVDKGLKMDTITKTIEATDTLTITGKDSIITRLIGTLQGERQGILNGISGCYLDW